MTRSFASPPKAMFMGCLAGPRRLISRTRSTLASAIAVLAPKLMASACRCGRAFETVNRSISSGSKHPVLRRSGWTWPKPVAPRQPFAARCGWMNGASISAGGREIARQSFARRELDGGEKALETAARKLSMPSVDEMLAKLGAAEISGRQIVGAVYPRILEKEPDIAQLGAQNGESPRACRRRPGQSALCLRPVL